MELEALLTKNEVCELLGVSEYWLTREIRAGNIPHYRIGKMKYIRFSPEQINQYLAGKEHHKKEA